MLVIAIDDADKTFEIVELANRHYPNLKLAVSAKDRRHAYQLIHHKVDALNRETFDSAMNLVVDALKLLGNDAAAERAGFLFRQPDIKSLEQLADIWGDDQSYGIAVRQKMDGLKQLLSQY